MLSKVDSGAYITTDFFTDGALDIAEQIDNLHLIDGVDLARLIIALINDANTDLQIRQEVAKILWKKMQEHKQFKTELGFN